MLRARRMSLEVQKYGEEGQGLVNINSGAGTSAGASAARADDDDLLPVVLERYLERAGVM